jgi:sulfur-oxidizing protein SoxZ
MGIKAIAKVKKDKAEVKLLIKHPMDSGRKMVDGKMTFDEAKAKFITKLTVTHKGNVVFDMASTSAISKDPFIKFEFMGAKKGDEIIVEWVDNKGETEKDTFALK